MKKFSIYRLISILAFIALVFILALPNFFDINKKQETEECIKNMRVVYGAAEEFLRTEQKDFSGTSSDLERMGYLSKSYECPSEAPGDKYHVKVDAETGKITVRCINEMNSSPDLTTSSFEDFVYFLNIIKFHQKPTSAYIYNLLSEETQLLLSEHEAYSNSLFDTRTVLDWDKFIANLNTRSKDPLLKELWEMFSPEFHRIVKKWNRIENPLTIEQKILLTDEINKRALIEPEFSDGLISSVSLDKEARQLHKRGYSDLNQIEKQRFNRILLEAIFPYEFQVGSKYNYPSDDLQEALIANLNELLAANAFDTQEFINMIKLSGETISKLEEQPDSRIQITLTNRLLLQDAYPSLLVKYVDQYSDHRLPAVN
ncbi:MAG: hypothetical protein K9M99_07115 [Candidatus Cloacimonetes bacterium]|nr:hypothetical protein [Candidatus Cloacimonadota bacterium]